MSTVRRAARNLGALSSAQILARASGLVITALLARHLGDMNFGTYTLCLSFAGIFGVLARMGVRQILLKDLVVNPEQSSRYIGTAVVAHLFQGALAVVAIAGTALILGYEGVKLMGILLMSVNVVFLAYESLFFSVFEARERMGVEAILILVRQAIWIVLAAIGIYTAQPYVVFVAALVLTSALVVILAGGLVHRRFASFSWRLHGGTARRLLKAGAPLAGAAILVDVYLKIDVLMLDQMTSETDVGHYGAAYRLISSFIFVSTSFFIVIFPIFSRLQAEAPDRLAHAYARSLKAISLILIPICAGLSGLAAPIMVTIYSAQYGPGASALAIAVWVIALRGIAAVMGRLLVALDQQVAILKVSLISVLLNLGLNFLLIPRYGIEGAAMASVFTVFCVAGMNYWLLRQRLEDLHLFRLLGRLYLVGAVMLLIVRQMAGLQLWISIPAGVVLYPLLLWIFRVLDAEDREMISVLLKRS